MLEKDFTTKFGQWFKDNKTLFPPATLIEVKVDKGNSFNLKRWRDGKQGHQAIALADVKTNEGVYHKISDQSSDVKPADIFFISNAEESYLVIYFDKYKEFFCIPQTIVEKKKVMQYTYCKKYLPTYTLPKKKERKILEF